MLFWWMFNELENYSKSGSSVDSVTLRFSRVKHSSAKNILVGFQRWSLWFITCEFLWSWSQFPVGSSMNPRLDVCANSSRISSGIDSSWLSVSVNISCLSLTSVQLPNKITLLAAREIFRAELHHFPIQIFMAIKSSLLPITRFCSAYLQNIKRDACQKIVLLHRLGAEKWLRDLNREFSLLAGEEKGRRTNLLF